MQKTSLGAMGDSKPFFLLLLSATIQPKGMSALKLHDAEERRGQYETNFRYWLAATGINIDGILLMENSGADLGSFHNLADRENTSGRKIEIIGLDMNDFPRELGKGFGEFRALDVALRQSQLAAQSDYLVKLTGRLRVRNLGSIIHNLDLPFDLCGDVHPYPDPARGVIDSRLIVFDRNFYFKNCMGLYEEMNDSAGEYAEHRFYQLVRRTPAARVVTRLPREPRWVGASGSTGERYDSLKKKIVYPMKILRRASDRMRGFPDLRTVRESSR
jgi:hypothetical protein